MAYDKNPLKTSAFVVPEEGDNVPDPVLHPATAMSGWLGHPARWSRQITESEIEDGFVTSRATEWTCLECGSHPVLTMRQVEP